MKLSALILTKNEEKMIEGCLKQLDFASEIIVLDENSDDKTQKIAKKYTTKVFTTDLKEFDKNRNTLANFAKGKWLLYLDADERLNNEAKDEIKKAIKEDKYSAYYFPRKNLILGKWLKHGGWWPDYVPRLFKKEKLISWQGKIHESPQVTGKFGYFKTPLEHYTAQDITSMFLKTVKWAKIEAKLFYKAKHSQVSPFKILKSVFSEFLSRFFIKRGFMDGTVGLIESLFQSFHRAIILTYLWELQNNSQEKFEKQKNA